MKGVWLGIIPADHTNEHLFNRYIVMINGTLYHLQAYNGGKYGNLKIIVDSNRSMEYYKGWAFKGKVINSHQKFISFVNSGEASQQLVYKNSQSLIDRLWRYVTGQINLQKAIDLFVGKHQLKKNENSMKIKEAEEEKQRQRIASLLSQQVYYKKPVRKHCSTLKR